MASIFKNLDYKNKPQRSAFDLSHRVAFTAKAGEILPVMCKLTLPGDKWKIRINHLTRTQPVSTCAFTRIQEHFDLYYVPLRLLWKSAGTCLTQMTTEPVQAKSLVDNLKIGTQTPYFTLGSLYNPLSSTGSMLTKWRDFHTDALNPFGFPEGPLSLKLLAYLRYGYVPENYADPDTSLPSETFKINVPLNPFPLLAYQKVYFDHFRNSQWEDNSAFCWNVDYNQGTELLFSSLEGNNLSNCLFTLRYANYPKDLFFGMQPNSQFGDVAVVDVPYGDQEVTLPSQLLSQNVSIPVSAGGTGDYQLRAYMSPDNVNRGVVGRDSNEPFSSTTGDPIVAKGLLSLTIPERKALIEKYNTNFSILALRQAEAAQRWKEISQTGGRNLRDQLYKHWNVTLPICDSGESIFIGGTSSSITINEVVSSVIDPAKDQNANIAGKGVGSDDKTFEYETNDYGVILCLYHAVPLTDYDIDGIDLQLLKTDASDYAIPEFDHIGMETLPSIALSMSRFADVNDIRSLGYVPRYIDYKTSVDIVLGAFKSTLKNWVAPISNDYFEGFFPKGTSINKNFFKINPHILDPIFGVEVNEYSDTDTFLINTIFDINAVRNLDYNGMPY